MLLSHLSYLLSHACVPNHIEPFATPLSMGFLGKNTGVGCHFLLQRIFLTRVSNPCLLPRQADSLPPSHPKIPLGVTYVTSAQQPCGVVINYLLTSY